MKLKIIFIRFGLKAVIFIASLSIITLAFLNRASKEIVVAGLAFVNAAIAGWGENNQKKIILTAMAMVAACITLYFTLQPESRSMSFEKTFVFDKWTRFPLHEEYKTFVTAFSGGSNMEWTTRYLVQEALKAYPSLAENSEIAKDNDNIKIGTNLYREILQWEIIDSLCFQLPIDERGVKNSWTGSGFCKIAGLKSCKIKRTALSGFFSENLLSQIPTTISFNEFSDFDVPAGTKLTTSPDKIQLTHPFFRVMIAINKNAGGSFGISHMKRLLQYSTKDNWRYWRSSYTLNLSSDFSSIRIGHPLMPKYRKWVDLLFDHLNNDFNTERHWEIAKEEYLLYQNVPLETWEKRLESQNEFFQEWKERVERNLNKDEKHLK